MGSGGGEGRVVWGGTKPGQKRDALNSRCESDANQMPHETAHCKTDSGWDGRKEKVLWEKPPTPTPSKASWLVRVLQLDPFATEKEKTEKNLEKPLGSLLSLLLLFFDGGQ